MGTNKEREREREKENTKTALYQIFKQSVRHVHCIKSPLKLYKSSLKILVTTHSQQQLRKRKVLKLDNGGRTKETKLKWSPIPFLGSHLKRHM